MEADVAANAVLNQNSVTPAEKANISADLGFVFVPSLKQECDTDTLAQVPKIESEAVLEARDSDESLSAGKSSQLCSSWQNKTAQVVTENARVKQEAAFSPHSVLSDKDCSCVGLSPTFVKTEEVQESDKFFRLRPENSPQGSGANIQDATLALSVMGCKSVLLDGVKKEHDIALPFSSIVSETSNESLNKFSHAPKVDYDRESTDSKGVSADTFADKFNVQPDVEIKPCANEKSPCHVQEQPASKHACISNPSLRRNLGDCMTAELALHESCPVKNESEHSSEKVEIGSEINEHSYENCASSKEVSVDNTTLAGLNVIKFSSENQGEIMWVKTEDGLESQAEVSLEPGTEISGIKEELSFESPAETVSIKEEGCSERQARSSWDSNEPRQEIQIGASWSMNECSFENEAVTWNLNDSSAQDLKRTSLESGSFPGPSDGDSEYSRPSDPLVRENLSVDAQHSGAHSNLKPFSCNLYLASFNTPLALNQHVSEQSHTNTKPFACTSCPETFSKVTDLRRHRQTHKKRVGRPCRRKIKTFACITCRKAFSNTSDLTRHTQIHSDERPYSCPYCSKTFKVKSYVKMHVNGVHNDQERFGPQSSSDAKRSAQDPECPENLRSDKPLRSLNNQLEGRTGLQGALHILTASTENAEALNMNEGWPKNHPHFTSRSSYTGCMQDFSPASGQRKVTEVRIDKRPYVLLRHRGTHSAERPFAHACPICSKMYRKNDNVAKHMEVVHFCKKRPEKQRFACLLCRVAFFQERYLQLHVETHGKKPDCDTAQLLEQDAQLFSCTLCSASFKTASDIDEHRRTHFKGLPCTLCTSVFSNSENLKRHMEIHSNVRWNGLLLDCAICSKTFKNEKAVIKHLEQVHCNERAFRCDLCLARFKTADSLAHHHRIHTNERPFACNLCPSTFFDSTTLRIHMKTHSDEKQFVCALCSKAFKDKSTVRHHLKHTHSNKKRFCCAHCPARFKTKGNLQKHLSTHTDQRPYSCPACPSAFSRARHLKLHMEMHKRSHVGTPPKTSKSAKAKCLKRVDERRFSCEVCSASFNTAGGLSRHSRIHPEGRPYACTKCTSFFPDSERLKKHMDAHSSERRHFCALCSKAFKFKHAVAKHMKHVHCDERPFSCEVCAATFKTVASLDHHRKCHTNDKPYVCTQCPRAFAYSGTLKTHMLVHSDAKPYICALCSKAFKSKVCVSQHLRQVHSDNKPFSCELCRARFHTSRHLRIHLCPNRPKVVDGMSKRHKIDEAKQRAQSRASPKNFGFSEPLEQRDLKNQSDQEVGAPKSFYVQSPTSKTQERRLESQAQTCLNLKESRLENGAAVIWIKNELSVNE